MHVDFRYLLCSSCDQLSCASAVSGSLPIPPIPGPSAPARQLSGTFSPPKTLARAGSLGGSGSVDRTASGALSPQIQRAASAGAGSAAMNFTSDGAAPFLLCLLFLFARLLLMSFCSVMMSISKSSVFRIEEGSPLLELSALKTPSLCATSGLLAEIGVNYALVLIKWCLCHPI